MTTDTTEKGLELTIMRALTGLSDAQIVGGSNTAVALRRGGYGGGLYYPGISGDYNRDHAVDTVQLFTFLEETQPVEFAQLGLDTAGTKRNQFLNRLQGEVAKRGILSVLLKGISHGPATVKLFYGTPSAGNPTAKQLWEGNRFSVTRQLQYSNDNTRRALDMVIFINGLPLATFELKNRLTNQNVFDAVQQYCRDRDPRELLFQFPRCLVHFAVDDDQVMFCTRLSGKSSRFFPFNIGWRGGAGNPPNPGGLKTDYLWKTILTREGLTDILENYAQFVVIPADKQSPRREELIFPRYHQLDAVRTLLAHAQEHGPGKRYLVQHSAGSGKSNTIAWLARQLVGLEKQGANVFNAVIVVTDRVLLDKQIRDTIRGFTQLANTVGHAEHSGKLKEYLQGGKQIVITTVQKFPFILDDIGNLHRDRSFAIIIDEAHSSQGGKTAAKMNQALSADGKSEEDEDTEDQINRLMEARKMLPNASYFAFTATPKPKTLEVFGVPMPAGEAVKFRAIHNYTMKQAIEEQFILDVLANYTSYKSYYSLVKTVEEDPEFDANKAHRKLKSYVEGHEYAIRQKAEIMVDHFHDHVLNKQKIGGQARAMVVTGSIQRAIEYFQAFQQYLTERKSPYQAIVAFSGEPEFRGNKVTEATLNGFPSAKISEKIKQEPYRFLICADKFQTGYDEPLLHTMYVDKVLTGIKAVQTLSRLNRSWQNKHDTFVLDFVNEPDTIREAFSPFYKTTILSGETDPNRLHDLKADLDGYLVYSPADIDTLVERYLGGDARNRLDPILDQCVANYMDDLDEDQQVDFKGKAKGFLRTYGFLSSVLPYSHAAWEKLSIFLNFLVPKLPAPKETDLSKGVLESIDMDSYRVEARSAMAIALADEDVEIGPQAVTAGGKLPEPELDRLSNILRSFNELFGNIEWKDDDKIRRVITEEIPAKVAADKAYQNAMKNSDKANARIEHDRALENVLVTLVADHMELFKQFSDNPSFKKWLAESNFATTYVEREAGG